MLLAVLGLAACGKRDAPVAPAAPVSTVTVPPGPTVSSDPSLPAAGSVVAPPTTATAQDAPSGRANGKMTREQESSAMPMPGQVNNHSSTALDPVKRGASAP